MNQIHLLSLTLIMIAYSCNNQPEYLLNTEKLNGTYDIKSANESNEEKIYNLISGSESFGNISFNGNGIGKLSMEVFILKEIQDIEYSQSGDTLLVHILPNGNTLKYIVNEIKGDYDYINVKLLNTNKDLIFVRR